MSSMQVSCSAVTKNLPGAAHGAAQAAVKAAAEQPFVLEEEQALGRLDSAQVRDLLLSGCWMWKGCLMWITANLSQLLLLCLAQKQQADQQDCMSSYCTAAAGARFQIHMWLESADCSCA